MDSPSPPRWSFTERAAYFGDRMCAFCDHRNPPGAKFCNECASPLHLKPCKDCDAVNDLVAAYCHHCGARFTVLAAARPAMPTGSDADAAPAPAAAAHSVDSSSAAQYPIDEVPVRAGGRKRRSADLLAAGAAAILLIGAYGVYRVEIEQPQPPAMIAQPVGGPPHEAANAAPAMPAASAPVEPERVLASVPPAPAPQVEMPEQTTVRQRPAARPATTHAAAHQQHGRARMVAARPVAPRVTAAPRGSRVVPAWKPPRPDPVQVMQVGGGVPDQHGQ